MIKLVASCMWICAVTAASAYVGSTWKANHVDAGEKSGPLEKLEAKKTRPVNVPIIANGNVQGYIVAQFVYTMDTSIEKSLSVPPEVYLLDEAFKAFYADDKLDFKHLERYDLPAFTKELLRKVNLRLKGDVVKDVLVDEFNYVSKDEIPK